MPAAKNLFLERMSSLAQSAKIEAVTNKSLSEKTHNDVARMLRNGLAVVGFAALEDFIKSRTSEVLSEVGRTNVPFRDLPERLRYAVTFEAISALSYQLGIRDKSDRIAYIQEHALKISSTAGSAYELTPHAFGYDQANLREDTVKAILKSFLVDDPWGEMTRLAARLALVSLPLEETFRTAALRRHRAAHVAHADTPQTDLIQFIKESYAIAIGFDVLLSKALYAMQRQDLKYLRGQSRINASIVKIRSIKFDGSSWKEMVEGKARAHRVGPDFRVFESEARSRASAGKELFVIYGGVGDVGSWECY